MDDRIFIGALVYLILAAGISGLLPAGLYTGTSFETPDQDDFASEYNRTTGAIGAAQQIGFLGKIVTFFFLAWVIDGIPVVIGLLIVLVNIVVLVIGGVYVYDKVRGIGS